MAFNFKECNRDQMYLLPPRVSDWLPEDHLAWFVLEAVEGMDLNAFYGKYRRDGTGAAAFEPSLMVSLLLYAYSNGVRSSRKIESLCETDVAYRVITANQKPDHTTIARFRQGHEAELRGLFVEILRLCKEAGLGKVGQVSLDGTKMLANASLSSNRTLKGIKKEVAKILAEAARVDQEEDEKYGEGVRGDELPPELRSRAGRLARLRQCKEKLEQETEEARAAQEEKLLQRKAEEAAAGQKKPGRKPRTVEEVVERKSQSQRSVTDPDSRIMHSSNGGKVQGYNAQVVAAGGGLIVASDVTSEANDVHQLHPLLTQAEENRESAGFWEEINVAVADAGYWSEENINDASPDGPELFIATTRKLKGHKEMRQKPLSRYLMSKKHSLKELMERKLRTKRGRRVYRMRAPMVEGVFGQIKGGRGIDRFARRGLSACQSEWAFVCATHNLLMLWRSWKTRLN